MVGKLLIFITAVASMLVAGTHFVERLEARPEIQTVSTGQTKLINLNTATAVELEKLPGIGPATAKLVVEYREKNGTFKKVEELMNVKGIGEKTFLKLKALITVEPPKSGSR
jgi:comEA protein